MNKVLIVLLAVCLVNIHAMVRREAPTTEKNYLEDIQNTLKDISGKINDQVSNALNPDELKKKLNSALDDLNKVFENVKNGIGAGGNSEAPAKA